MDKPKFVYVTYIDSTPEKVWEALTHSEFTTQYWCSHRIESDWKQGALVKFIRKDGSVNVQGEVLQFNPPHLLSYTWYEVENGKPKLSDNSRVTFEITTGFGVTKLTVTHDEFSPGSTLIEKISEGWPAVLSSLKTMLESGKAISLNMKC